MPKRTGLTKVMMNGVNLSRFVCRVDIPRDPQNISLATLDMHVDRLEVEPDGTLVIHLEGPEGLHVRPAKRIIL